VQFVHSWSTHRASESWISDPSHKLKKHQALCLIILTQCVYYNSNTVLMIPRVVYLTVEWRHVSSSPLTNDTWHRTLHMFSNSVAPWRWLRFVAETRGSKKLNSVQLVGIKLVCFYKFLHNIQWSLFPWHIFPFHSRLLASSSLHRSEDGLASGLKTKLNSVALVRERTIPTERPPPVGEVRANFCG